MSSLSIARFRPATQAQPKPLKTTTETIGSLVVQKGNTAVVYSQRLDGLQAGEQLRVRATVKTSCSHLGYPVRVKTEILLAEDPTRAVAGDAKRVVSGEDPQICRGNGKNCLPTDNPMVSPKAGSIRISKDAKGPLYVNVAIEIGDPTGQANTGDALRIVDGGFLAVTRYPPTGLG